MEETRMDRSVFHAVKDHQQIEKYDTLNTYNIILSSHRGSDAYTTADPPVWQGRHDQFKIRIPDNGSTHIKNARARLKFVSVPPTANANAVDGGVSYLSLNIVKNTMLAGSNAKYSGAGYNNNIFSGFSLKEIRKATTRDTDVPALRTFGGVMDTADPDGFLKDPVAGNLGGVGESTRDGILAFAEGTQATLSDVQQGTYKQYSTTLVEHGVVGADYSSAWVPCDNPFGKELEVKFLRHDFVSVNTNFGDTEAHNTTIQIEVQLVPDNQANDKFSY